MRDKVVVITGASAGIGAALAELLGRGGARLVLVARRQSELDAVAARAGDAIGIAADMTRRNPKRTDSTSPQTTKVRIRRGGDARKSSSTAHKTYENIARWAHGSKVTDPARICISLWKTRAAGPCGIITCALILRNAATWRCGRRQRAKYIDFRISLQQLLGHPQHRFRPISRVYVFLTGGWLQSAPPRLDRQARTASAALECGSAAAGRSKRVVPHCFPRGPLAP